ncbi:dehydrogenase [Asticcacaulis sp. AC460]|uniref:zinc-binding alcohol dehydrogenase family protein n=1 Tax=Asticcacaulis sp. AC460 TaxID=1282360 RepID=UPI0003C3BF37|nr:zinc-binding alcohol dehydrogenase family protein [Asticcacaulis sp. AC460]ESQ89418.1 dehydrogenase [Asticcacaulis sp. AC460]
MLTVSCNKPFDLSLAERPVPVRRDGEVLVRIRRIGMCGTDFHIFSGNQPYLSYPRIMGHELSGEVLDADPGSPIRIGATVTINPYLRCRTCHACRRDKPNCCMNIRVMGVHIDGGMAEYVTVPEEAIIDVEGLSFDQAAMVEFLAIGMHAVRRGAVTAADRVLVVGAGAIGVGVALFAKMTGADVAVIDTNSGRLERARSVCPGIETALAGPDADAWLRDTTGGDFFDVVFDASGNSGAMQKGFAYVAHGGRYVLVSVVSQDITFSDPEFHKREMQLIGSRNATKHDFQMVIDMIRDGAIPTDKLHTHSLNAVDLPHQVPELLKTPDDLLKAIVTI